MYVDIDILGLKNGREFGSNALRLFMIFIGILLEGMCSLLKRIACSLKNLL